MSGEARRRLPRICVTCRLGALDDTDGIRSEGDGPHDMPAAAAMCDLEVSGCAQGPPKHRRCIQSQPDRTCATMLAGVVSMIWRKVDLIWPTIKVLFGMEATLKSVEWCDPVKGGRSTLRDTGRRRFCAT
jgi:hypothetical protein